MILFIKSNYLFGQVLKTAIIFQTAEKFWWKIEKFTPSSHGFQQN